MEGLRWLHLRLRGLHRGEHHDAHRRGASPGVAQDLGEIIFERLSVVFGDPWFVVVRLCTSMSVSPRNARKFAERVAHERRLAYTSVREGVLQ